MTQPMPYPFPLITVVIGAQFPAGLTPYWITTTLFQIVQQYFVSGWGQLPKYLPFLRTIPTPADKDMKRETKEALQEERADMAKLDERAGGTASGDDVNGGTNG